MPSFNNLKRMVGPQETTEANTNELLQNIQGDDDRRTKGLNDFMNKSLDPPSLDPDSGKDIPIPQSQLPSAAPAGSMNMIKQKLSQYLPKEDTEDKVPYDPNAGTMTNIGRFALNNLASDKFSGAFPAAGALKLAAPLAEEVATRGGGILGGELAAKAAMNHTADSALAHAAANPETESLIENQLKLLSPSQGNQLSDVARTQQQASRAIDYADRLRNSSRSAALNRLRNR